LDDGRLLDGRGFLMGVFWLKGKELLKGNGCRRIAKGKLLKRG
jgi:hypothetical protein